jgi:hypothetical protein
MKFRPPATFGAVRNFASLSAVYLNGCPLQGEEEIVSRIASVTCTIAAAALLSAAAVFAQTPAAPAPPALHNAKRIFISNAGADSGLFPHPFSGSPDRGYGQLYAALKATGDYKLVSDPREADLVLELRLTAPYGPSNADKQKGASDPLPMFRLVIYEAGSHYVLWALTEAIDPANLQKTHDRNFDEALTAIALDFESLSGKAPAGAH